MPIANYIQPNEYNLVKDIRPMDMPYEAYMREIATKQQYWRVGADRIKSIYDQAANLDPQYLQGREYLKGFMDNATKNLEKISRSDLSIMDNSQQAARVFKPLFDVSNPFNAALLQDSQLNQFYKKQQQLSDAYRTKDGGKDWNINNEIYYRDGQSKYMQDAMTGDYSTIAENYQNRKSFIPYYDYKDEITKIQEACKGASTESQAVASNPGYFEYNSRSGCDPQRLALAYQTGLSDRAKQQMRIDGYAHFRGNEDVLARKFADYSVNNAKKEIDLLEAKVAGLKAGKVTKDVQAQIDNYQEILDMKKPAYEKNVAEYNSMVKGNPLEYVKNNYDRLAGQVYFDELTNSLGESFRTDDTKRKFTPNAVEMQQRKINADINLQVLKGNQDMEQAKQEHFYKLDEQKQKAALDYELEKAKGNIAVPTTGVPVFGVTEDTPNIPKVSETDFINENVTPAQKASDDAYSELTDYIKSKYGNAVVSGRGDDGIETFVNEHNGKDKANQDKDLLAIYNNFKNANREWTASLNKVRAVDEKVKREHPELFDNTRLKDVKSVKIEDQEITAVDMKDILSGKTVKGITYVPGDYGVSSITASGNIPVNSGSRNGEFYKNGKLLNTSPTGIMGNTNPLISLRNKVSEIQGDVISKISDIKTGIYTSKYYNNGDFTENNITIKAGDALDQRLQSLLNTTAGNLEKNGYKITHRDRTGSGIYIQTLDSDAQNDVGNKPTDETLALLKANYQGAKKVKTPNGWAYYIPNFTQRYETLPSDVDLATQQKNVDNITNLKDLLETDPRLISSSWKDSAELPDGTITIDTPGGKEATVSIIYGKSTGFTYAARIPGVERVIKAGSALELQNLLKQF